MLVLNDTHRCLAGCGRAITWQFAICKDCEEIYGRTATNWPDWLRYLWANTQRSRRLDKMESMMTIPLTSIDNDNNDNDV